MKRSQKINNKNDWAQFALGYIHLAALACTQINDKKYIDPDFDIKSIFIPALFNFKHGIEVLLKTFSIEFLKKESLNPSDYSHDIDQLFSILKKGIDKDSLKNAIKKYNDSKKDLKETNASTWDETTIFDELEDLVKKYYHLDFLKSKIGTNYNIQDNENTALKYPTNDLIIQINYEKLSEKFISTDAIDLLTDCNMLEAILWQFYILLYMGKTN